MKSTLPFGAWPSRLTSEAVASASVRLAEPRLDVDDLYWLETRPSQQGRTTLLRRTGDGRTHEIVPSPFSVRNRVHEYGGGAFAVEDGLVVFANDADQRLYLVDGASGAAQPTALTPADGTRYADLVIDRQRKRLICVAERARSGGEPENLLVAVDLDSGEVRPLARGADFYACPRIDPTGQRLAYLSWDHPAMPWDSTHLHVADLREDGTLGRAVTVAGGVDEAISGPAWSPAGRLFFVSDRSGFCNLFRMDDEGKPACVHDKPADFAAPAWVFGLSSYAFLDEHTVLCSFQEAGLWHLGTVEVDTGRLAPVPTHLTQLGYLVGREGRTILAGGSATDEPALYAYEHGSRSLTLVHRPAALTIDEGDLARPQPITFAGRSGASAHGLVYLPCSVAYDGPAGERPPLIVVCHGGPTGSTSTALNLAIQFWTSRGFAVLDVNYRGSTGYGRTYRKALDRQWGVVDVEDCVDGARALAERGVVDGKRMAIRGSSAGGFTVLCALAFHDAFAVGASYYGVSDLEALAKDTHKFESRYLDSLVGPYPERRDLYRARSPVHAAARIACPVIFFQGDQDRVVPPDQTVRMADALASRGLEAPVHMFPGEQHGFRRKETIAAALNAELAFYRKVFAI